MTPSRSLFVLFLICLSSSEANKQELKRQATEEVLSILRDKSQYDSVVMPLNSTGPINSEVQIYFREVVVDDIKMQITVDMTFRMKWKDNRLSYTPSASAVPHVTLTEPELAWIPDAFFKRAVSTAQQTTVLPQNFLRVHRDGRLTFSTRLIVVFSCPMDFRRFPHDKQECPISIASYGFTASDLTFKFADTHPITYTTEAMESLNFHMDGVITDTCNSKTSTGVYSCVEVILKLSRQVSSYIMEFYVPCIFMVIIAAMSEIIQPTELIGRLMLTIIPLISLCLLSIMYGIVTLPSVTYTRPIDIFSGISLLVIFCQLIRVMVIHYYTQRKIKEESGELLPRHPRDDCFETVISNANLISRVTLTLFYLLFLLAYFLAYSVTM